MEKENVFLRRQRKMKEEMEEIIWRRKVYFCGREEKGGKYLEKENMIFFLGFQRQERIYSGILNS